MCHAIVAAWYEFDGPAGFLGKSRGSIHAVSPYDDTKKEQDFERGCIHYDTIWESTRVYFRENNGRLVRVKAPLSEIMHEYYRLGGEEVLGLPTSSTDQPNLSGSGMFREFERPDRKKASIHWTETTGARMVQGTIRDCWMNWKSEFGYLGFPVEDEKDHVWEGRAGRISVFQGGAIFRYSDTGSLRLFEFDDTGALVLRRLPNQPIRNIFRESMLARSDKGAR